MRTLHAVIVSLIAISSLGSFAVQAQAPIRDAYAITPPLVVLEQPESPAERNFEPNKAILEPERRMRNYWTKTPYAKGEPVKEKDLQDVLTAIIGCESQGSSVEALDTNGKYSRGILQFQDATWDAFSKESGIVGSPLRIADAKQMALWAFRRGYLSHWSCATILGIIKK